MESSAQRTPTVVHETMWNDAINEYGSDTAVPAQVANHIAETVRALEILARVGEGNPMRVLREYMVRDEIIQEVLTDYIGIKPPDDEHRESRAKRERRLEEYSREHEGEQFTTEHLADVAGFSQQTMVHKLRRSPWWQPVKRGVWEASNPANRKR
jgi:hypothetical protein